MDMPKIVSSEEWLENRKKLLVKEKEFGHLRDAIVEERRQLPVVKIEKEYIFEGLNGPVTLLELFGKHSQLIIYHFMFDPDWEAGCAHCSHCADTFQGATVHLAARNTAFSAISRAPIQKIEGFKERMDWSFPWYSSFSNEFNYDFHVTIDKDAGSTMHNYSERADFKGEESGVSAFLREGDTIYHTYSSYSRGLDLLLTTYNFLDLTILGRQEGKSPDEYPQAWVRHKDRYGT
jgi:predicted dithiol-disulfide oxidoreductase (DUF899 family)